MTAGTGRPVYMDHNATTPTLPAVFDTMVPWFTDEFGNASSSTHTYGKRAGEAVATARSLVAKLIGADPEEIAFTSGATESDNLAIRGVTTVRETAGTQREHGHVITCAIEHEAVLETAHALEKEGWLVTVLPVDPDGLVDPDDVARAITERTVLVSIMLANNEIGTIEPLGEIGAICRRRGVLLHTDAVQAAGRIPVDVTRLQVDMMSLTAHKMYGPKGVGALYVRKGVTVSPMVHGGGQERNVRSGTLNVPGIVGFGKAAEMALTDMGRESARQLELRDHLWSRIREEIPGATLNGHPSRRLPNNLNVAFDGVESEGLLMALRDVAALSSGSACASGTGKGSYVITALEGETRQTGRARSSIRFGLGRSNEQTHIDHVMQHLPRAVARLRAMAPGLSGSRAGR